MRHAGGHLNNKRTASFFHYEPNLSWDVSLPWTISKSSIYLKHVFKKVTLHLKVRIWPQMKKKKRTPTTLFYVVRSLTFSQAQWGKKERSKNRNKQLQHRKKKKKVWMFFKESTSHLRKDSSRLLLKYINSVLVLHLQLEPK